MRRPGLDTRLMPEITRSRSWAVLELDDQLADGLPDSSTQYEAM